MNRKELTEIFMMISNCDHIGICQHHQHTADDETMPEGSQPVIGHTRTYAHNNIWVGIWALKGRIFHFNPLNPHDASKHHFATLKNDLIS